MLITIREATYYVDCVGEGEPLLLIHGFSGSHEQWKPFIHSWSSSYKLIMIDMLGHGASQAPTKTNRYSMQEIVEDLAHLLDALHLTKAHVLGYSMGGRIALSFAIAHRERVQSLILESSSPGLSTPEEREARRRSDDVLAERIERQGIQWFAQYWGELPLFASLNTLSVEQRERLHRARLNNSPYGLAQSLRGVGTGQQPSWWEHLESLSMPVLLIAGALDTKYCGIAQKMNKVIAQAELEIVSEAGHNVHMEQALEFDTIIKSFLTKKRMV